MVKNYWILPALAAFTLLSSGCVKEEEKVSSDSTSLIKFKVVEAEVVDTESLAETKSFEITSDSGKTLPVACETSQMELNLEDFMATKGTRYGSEAGFQSETFGVYSWEGTEQGFNGVSVSYDKKASKWIPASKQYWPNKATLTFAAVYPVGGCNFTAIAPDNMNFTGYTVAASAADQKDLMLANNTCSWSDTNPGQGTITFSHALTCVNFSAGTLVDVVSIDKISLEGVHAGGNCTVTLSSTAAPTYEWATSGTKIVTSSGAGIAQAKFSELGNDPNFNFLIIPQDARVNNVTLHVTLTTTSGQETFHVTLNSSITGLTAWKAGKVNTFILGYDGGDVELSVDDDVDEDTKDNLKICNTGTTDAYFRVALVGNWQNDEGNIVDNWDETQGTFTGLPGTNWFKHTDGFYYYKNPVNKASDTTPTEITNKLFTKYTAPATPPVEGAVLHLDIVVQAVKYDNAKAKVTEAWGSTVAGKLNTK